MGNKESVQISSGKRTMIFICLVVSGIASSTLSTAMTTALPNLVEYFGVSTSLGTVGYQRIFSGYGNDHASHGFSHYQVPYEKTVFIRYRDFYPGTASQYLLRQFRDHDGGKSPSGLRKRYPYGGGSGCDPYGLSH